MASFEDDLMQDALDDIQAVEFIKNYLPQELKERFNDETLLFFLDVLAEYYEESGILDSETDEEGCVEVDVEEIAKLLAERAKLEKVGDFTPEETLFVVTGDLAYTESLDLEE